MPQIQKSKNRNWAFTLIEITIVVVIIWILTSIVLGIYVNSKPLLQYKIINLVLNNNNVYVQWDWKNIKICNIWLTWDVGNTELYHKNDTCKIYPFSRKTFLDWVEFYKVESMFLDNKLMPINLQKWIVEINNWILSIK